MFGRVTNEAIGDQVDEREGQPAGLERDLDAVGRGRFNLRDHQHAHRQQTFLTTIVLLFVRTARHVGGHRRHVGHLSDRPLLRAGWSYQRLRDEPGDHEDRQQTTDESIKKHDFLIALNRNGWKVNHFTSTPAKSFDEVKTSKIRWLTRHPTAILGAFYTIQQIVRFLRNANDDFNASA